MEQGKNCTEAKFVFSVGKVGAGLFNILQLAVLVVVIACVGIMEVRAAGLGQREPNTTLKLSSQPASYMYALQPAFGSLAFTDPVAVVTAPGDRDRVFVVEQGGRILLIENLARPTSSVFLDISDRIAFGTPEGEGGILGLAFHPNYAVNGQFFVYYLCNVSTGDGAGRHNRLSRFTRSKSDPTRGDAGSETVLFTQFDQEFNHNGGTVLFGPDGYLYITLGDEGFPDDVFENGQRIDKDFFGGVMRLDVDRRPTSLSPNPHNALGGKTNYWIPRDNPFVGATSFNGQPVDPAKVRTEFWAVGLRSPWRMYYDEPTGNLYVSDVGEIGRINNRSEEINLIYKGFNYGWPYYESEGPGPKFNQMPAGFSSEGPLITYDRGNSGPYVGRAAIGGVVYRGARLPELSGCYIFGDYYTGNIWKLRHSGKSIQQWEFLMAEAQGHIVSFALDPSNGDVLVCDVSDDTVKRLVRVPGDQMAPPTLADTGAFADLSTLEPNPGIVPYDVNASFWSDGALKRRWFSVPNVNEKITAGKGAWEFPVGTVWIKHFDLEMVKGDPSTARRVETRFLVKDETGVWGLTYDWGDSQDNAALVPGEGRDRTFTINDNGVIRQQNWHFPARNECISCHTPVAGHALAFNSEQLNRNFNYGNGSANQLRAMAAAGYFKSGNGGGGRPLAAIDDNKASLETRVRSYLAANCAPCHQPGGPARSLWDARASTPLARAGIVNGALNDRLGNPANRVVAPRSPEQSILLHRIKTLEHGIRMPPLASSVVDEEAVALIEQWINTLPKKRQPLSVRVTGPKGSRAGQQISIRGIASGDNLAKVVYSLNGGEEQEASGVIQWSADLILQPGVNRLVVYALDNDGNRSRPAKRTFRSTPAADQ